MFYYEKWIILMCTQKKPQEKLEGLKAQEKGGVGGG